MNTPHYFNAINETNRATGNIFISNVKNIRSIYILRNIYSYKWHSQVHYCYLLKLVPEITDAEVSSWEKEVSLPLPCIPLVRRKHKTFSNSIQRTENLVQASWTPNRVYVCEFIDMECFTAHSVISPFRYISAFGKHRSHPTQLCTIITLRTVRGLRWRHFKCILMMYCWPWSVDIMPCSLKYPAFLLSGQHVAINDFLKQKRQPGYDPSLAAL